MAFYTAAYWCVFVLCDLCKRGFPRAATQAPPPQHNTATAGFCLPSAGPATLTLSAYRDKSSPTYNMSARTTQLLRV